MKTETLSEKIMAYAETLDKGMPVLADDLADLGDRGAINRSLAGLARCGRLSRVARGIYVKPVVCRFGKYAPGTRTVAEAMAARRGEHISTTVGMSANCLRLTDSFPVLEWYLTSGRTREYRFENLTVRVLHAPLWLVMFGDTMPGHLLRGLDWLGPGWREEYLDVLRRQAGPHLDEVDRQRLLDARNMIPRWAVRPLERVVADG